jgi:GNAT superfamily N-acetyltransferase
MSSYRFCRTDDIGLLVDALNRCWRPHFPDEEPMTPAAFKRWIRDLQVWCSSCMVAFAGGDPIAVVIGAKRPSTTLIHKIAVHPDHLRQGHGRHLLTSLSSKLSILGPPRLVAEVPEAFAAASALFNACGYAEEAILTDQMWDSRGIERTTLPGRFMVPVSVDDLEANGLLEDEYPPTCWERSVATLNVRKDEISGIAIATEDGIEAYILYIEDEILALRTLADDGGSRLRLLLARGGGPFRFPKVHPAEMSKDFLQTLGFRPSGNYLLYASTAR